MDPADTAPFVVSIIGTVSSALLQLSPIGVMREIIRNQSVGCYRPDPFITGIGFGLVNGTYSIVSNQLVSTISTGIGLTLFTIYLIIYVYHSNHKAKDIGKAALFLSVAVSVAGIGPLIFKLVDQSDSGHEWTESNGGLGNMIDIWLGVCATLSIVLMFSGQLTNMVDVIKRKDARSISMMMALAGLCCSCTWTIYAALIVNPYFLISNGLGVVSSTTQVVLKRIYPDSGALEVVEEKPTTETAPVA